MHGDTTHVTRFRYDGNGRLIEEDQHGHLLRHLYDALGQRTQRNTPHRATRYGYDALGALTQVGALTIQRDGLGRETGRQAGDFIAQRRYDAVGRLLRQAAGPRAAFDALQTDPVQALQQLTRQNYRYDAAGQLAQVETDADRFTYQHDARGQVTAVGSMRQPAEHYTYNATQNIAAHGRQGPIDARHYLPGGLPERVGYTRYRYDARGRTIEKTVEQPGFRPKIWRYGWDGLNRLVKVHTPDKGTWVYRYDAFNRRVEKVNTGTGESVRFVWDGYALAERWGQKRDGTTGQVVTWHITPDFVALAQETDDGIYPVLTDQIGLPKAVFDEAGKKVWGAGYTLWGGLTPTKGAANDAPVDTTLRFPGQWGDDESGLSYNLNRYYDPEAGQYLSVDPLGVDGGLRTHGYVENPNGWQDPLGLASCPAKSFSRKDRITQRWVDKLTGKAPVDVDAYLTSRGWAKTYPQAGNPNAIQHTQYVRSTKSGVTYKLDYHPGGSPTQQNIHGNDYWKVYKVVSGEDVVFGRIGHDGFKNYDLIKDSPVYVDGVLVNGS